MNNQKLIMEGWRSWLSGLFGKSLTYKDLGLLVRSTSQTHAIVIYAVQKDKKGAVLVDGDHMPIVVGQMSLVKTEKPCIPNTFQVSTVAVSKDYQGKGLGTMLYKIAAEITGDAGITSDHKVSTKDSAKAVWDKIDKDSKWQKRQTRKGNDEFDYSGDKTPDDPKDDCESPIDSKNTIDHSYDMLSSFSTEVSTMKENHGRYAYSSKNFFGSKKAFEQALLQMATKLFSDEYNRK